MIVYKWDNKCKYHPLICMATNREFTLLSLEWLMFYKPPLFTYASSSSCFPAVMCHFDRVIRYKCIKRAFELQFSIVFSPHRRWLLRVFFFVEARKTKLIHKERVRRKVIYGIIFIFVLQINLHAPEYLAPLY